MSYLSKKSQALTVEEKAQQNIAVLEKRQKEETVDDSKDEKYYSRLGWIFLLLGVGGSFFWATFATIDKGVSTSGYVMTDSNRKTIQSPLSGFIEDIKVKEGQTVKEGEVLVKINPIAAAAQAQSTKETIQGLEGSVRALEISIQQKKKQYALLSQQLKNMQELSKDGYMATNRVLEFERQESQLKTSISDDEGNLIRTRQQISEAKERLNPMELDLANTDVKSPVNGRVVNLQVFTKGGVVSPGVRLMEVIPTNDDLMIEAQLPVHLVDKVQEGLEVEMMFTAFNTNRTPHIPGVLLSIAADRIVDEKTGMPYYKIQAKATEAGKKLLGSYKVRPGMPVDLFVKTGEQSPMTYILKPVTDRFHSALRED